MSNTNPDGPRRELSREEMISAAFANLVVQQTNTALLLLGRVPNPETGETIQDLEGAQLFIDQLEMLAVKTKGNLDPREERFLQQSLTTLRLAFVEAVEKPSPAAKADKPAPAAAAGSTSSEPSSTATAPSGVGAAPQEESHKKFSKKY